MMSITNTKDIQIMRFFSWFIITGCQCHVYCMKCTTLKSDRWHINTSVNRCQVPTSLVQSSHQIYPVIDTDAHSWWHGVNCSCRWISVQGKIMVYFTCHVDWSSDLVLQDDVNYKHKRHSDHEILQLVHHHWLSMSCLLHEMYNTEVRQVAHQHLS